MTFQESVRTVLTEKYAQFSGRASRSEFWWFVLAYIIGALIVSFIPFLPFLYWLALVLPTLAVGWRRMQDIGKPGWYFLIPTIYNAIMYLFGFGAPEIDPATGMPLEMPSMGFVALGGLFGLIGLVIAVIYLWWLTRPSQPGENEYGPPPADAVKA